MNEKPASMPTCSWWMRVRRCVRQLVVDGSHNVSAARADVAHTRRATGAMSQRRPNGIMPPRSARAVPQPFPQLEWNGFTVAERSAAASSEIEVFFCPCARQFRPPCSTAATRRGCFETLRAGQFYIAEKQHE